jgi:hypothetical protein
MRVKVLALSTVVVVGALLALAPTAAADQPVVTEQQIDRTSVRTGFCDFPIVIHTVGTFRTTDFSNGKEVAHTIDFHITYSNPATGKSVSTVLGGPFIIVPNGDGTVTATINGNDGHETVPGEGTIYADVGKLVYIADASDPFTPLTILKSTGRQDPAQFPVTCTALV